MADPMDVPLPCDVRFPGVTFKKGVPLRLLVNAASRWKQMADAACLANLPPDAKEQIEALRALAAEAGDE